MEECKHVSIPTTLGIKLDTSSNSQLVDAIEYMQLIGSLLYFPISRPDIAYVVNLMARFMHKPYVDHIHVAKNILRYILGKKDLSLKFTKFPSFILSGFSYYNYGGDRDDRKFTFS